MKLPLEEGRIDPDIVPPLLLNLYSCSSPVAELKTPVTVFKLEILATLVFILGSRLLPVSIRLLVLSIINACRLAPVISSVCPVVVRSPSIVSIWGCSVLPVEIKLLVKVWPVIMRFPLMSSVISPLFNI